MANRLQEIRERLKEEERARAQEIHRLRATGMTLEEIGEKFGISRQRVWKILQERKPDNKSK